MSRSGYELMQQSEIAAALLAWYQENRRNLPWRRDKDPYHVWVSEIMLQQTRVEAVKEYYKRFLERLPTVQSLAEVSDDELMKLWQGLGYYNRARNMKKAAEILVREYDGVFPDCYEEILKLPGIGAYTAGAIASISFGIRVPAADGNVYRIYTRLFQYGEDILQAKVQRKIREEVEKMLPEQCSGDFNQALMDLGAGVCLPNGKPLCDKCPLFTICEAGKNGTQLAYPFKSPKKKRKVEKKTVFVFEYDGKYFLQKRPDKGLLAGLWEFPTQAGHLGIEEVRSLLGEWGDHTPGLELLGTGTHIFSHIEWRMIGYLVHLKKLTSRMEEEFVLADRKEILEKYSVPSAYSFYLNQILYDAT